MISFMTSWAILFERQVLTLEKKTEQYDVVIMDIPYGVYSPFSYEQQLDLLKGAFSLAPSLLLVSHIPMNKELETLGYEILDCATIIKGSFQRYMTLCWKK